MTEEQTPGGVDRGQVMLVVLIALAFIASIVMLFTNSDGALKLALLAALWAAIIGFFLVFRYRRDAEAARRELEHHSELHDAEVARAAAEREARAESRALEVREKQHSRDSEVLADIQRELAALRAQLEAMAGRPFEYEPAAVRAEARRVQELEAAAFAETDTDPVESEVPAPSETRPTGGAPSPDAIAGRLGQQPSRPHPNPLADIIREKQADKPEITETRAFSTDTFQAVPWVQGRDAVVEKQEEPAEEEPRRGRRRRDENEAGLSVAEILARARENRGE